MAERHGVTSGTGRRRAGLAALVVGGLGAAVGGAALTACGPADPAPAAAPAASRPTAPGIEGITAATPAPDPATVPSVPTEPPAGTPGAAPAGRPSPSAAAPTTAKAPAKAQVPPAPGTAAGRPATTAARAPQPSQAPQSARTTQPGPATGAPGGPGATVPEPPAAPAPVAPSNPPAPGPAVPPPGPVTPEGGTGLNSPRLKDIAQQLVSSAENSSLNWRAQYTYIEDIHDGRGYTGGIVGFTSGTGDMLQLVRRYQVLKPGNVLARYLPALEKVDGSASHSGLDPSFVADWHRAAQDAAFQQAQNDERDRVYFDPAVDQAKADGLHALGQFAYYDALVMHGPGSDRLSFGGIRAAALAKAKPPSRGGDETAYLNAFLDARRAAMKADSSHQDTGRVDTMQRVFLKAGNLSLATPLRWTIYGDAYSITS